MLHHSHSSSIPLPSFLYDHGHVINETNPSDETIVEAIKEETEFNGKLRTRHQGFVTTNNPNINSKNLKRLYDEELSNQARTLETQGEWAKLYELQSKDTSFNAITKGLSEQTYMWLLKASSNSAPTMSYLLRINRAMSSACPRCGKSPETLHHALNNCTNALENGLYTWRHNKVLSVLHLACSEEFPEPWEVRVDLATNPRDTIPSDIIPTMQRPDLTLINRQEKEFILVELTICWDIYHQPAKERKEQRYASLTSELNELGWKSQLLTIEIGSRGYSSNDTASNLKKLFNKKKQRSNLLTRMNQEAITASYCIFIHRKDLSWSPT